MKRILSVLLIILMIPACAFADVDMFRKTYNTFAGSIFNVPKLEGDPIQMKETYTGGTLSAWIDSSGFIGFIEDDEENVIGGLCVDSSGNDADFLLRCANLIFAIEPFELGNYTILFSDYVQIHKDPTSEQESELVGGNRLLMVRSKDGFLAAYVLGE